MSTPLYQPGVPLCPLCGGPMEARPSLDGSSWVALCPSCPNAPMITLAGPPQPPSEAREAATARFRKLTQPLAPPDAGAWPEALLEDLPTEARDLLRQRPPSKRAAGTAQLREEMAATLRDQGYVLNEDARGLRIGGSPVSRGRGSGRLSSSDVVRLAAELNGGAPPPEKRATCPKCHATVSVEATRCEWCGVSLQPPAA